jgi:hypothetical protein
MSANTVRISLKINFPVILIAVLLLHALFLMWQGLEPFKEFASGPDRLPLKIQDIRTVGSKESKNQNSTYVSKTPKISPEISKEKYAPEKSLSLSDLSESRPPSPQNNKQTRPGTRPEVVAKSAKAIDAVSLKGSDVPKFLGSSAATLSGDPRAAGLDTSDVMVNLEVPEGVSPDELNEYELMFYGFQRRTAINYINSFYKNLNEFQRKNPHLQFPLTKEKQVMTGRLTYDEKGNIKQIKMVRWTNVEKLQDFFLDVLKDMDTLHNPPQALWEKNGEFSVFFSLVVNG